MSELRLDTWQMPAARLGSLNPLPPLRKPRPSLPPLKSEFTPGAYVAWDFPGRCLPYRLQDDYDRVRSPRAFKAIVLENDILRATFLPELAGRLWSLVHKRTDRELLYPNPVFQPANLRVGSPTSTGYRVAHSAI